MRILTLFKILIIFIFSCSCYASQSGSVTGLPLPRFVILKSSETNLRKGPNTKFPIAWNYKQKGYPMQLVAEFENWRKLQDHDGSEGWVHEKLITGSRNVVILNNVYRTQNKMYLDRASELIIFRYPDETSFPMARVQFGSIGKLKSCNKEWCKIKIEGITGWALKSNLWGVAKEEVIN